MQLNSKRPHYQLKMSKEDLRMAMLHELVLDITYWRGNANQNHNEISLHAYHRGCRQKDEMMMLARICHVIL